MNRFQIAIGKESPRFESVVTPNDNQGTEIVSNQGTEIVSMQERIPLESFILNPGTRDEEQIVYRAERRLLNALLMKLQPFVAMSSHDDQARHERVITGTIEIIRPRPRRHNYGTNPIPPILPITLHPLIQNV